MSYQDVDEIAKKAAQITGMEDMDMQEYRLVSASLQENVTYVNEMLPVEDSFDIVQRNIVIGGRNATFYFVDGFTKDESMLKLMDSFFSGWRNTD